MKSYLVLLPIFILALIEGAFLPLNLVLLVVLIWAAIRPFREATIVAFFSGILLDLARGGSLGISSLVFLIVSSILHLYARRFDPLYPAFLPVFTFFSTIIYQLSTINYISLPGALVLAFSAFLARPLVRYFSPVFGKKEIRLKL